MKQLRSWLLLISLYSVAVAQETIMVPPSQLVHKTHAERTILLNRFYEGQMTELDSAQVFRYIQRIQQLAAEENDPELALEAKVIEAHFFVYSAPSQTTVARHLQDLADLADAEKVVWLQVRAHSLLGNFQAHIQKEYEKGIFHLTKAAALMDNRSSMDYPLKQACNLHVGNWLLHFSDTKTAIEHLKKAFEATVPEGMSDYTPIVLNSLGFIYRQLGKLDSSDMYFQKCVDYSKEINDSTCLALSSGNLGENHFLKGAFDEAKPLLEYDAAHAIGRNDWGVASNALTLLGDIALSSGNMLLADSLLSEAKKMAFRSERKHFRLNALYPRLAKFYAAQGNPQLASIYIDSAIYTEELLEREKSELLMTKANQRLEREQYLDDLKTLELERSKKELERNALIGLAIALLIIAGLVYNALWRKYQLKQQQLKLRETELEASKKRMFRITERLAERNLLIKNLKEKVDKSSENALSELQQKTILTQEDWDEFQELFNEVFDGYLSRLAEKFPELSQADTRFVALTKLGISSNKMTEVLGVGKGTIRQYRLRIRKKFNLTTDDDLFAFIERV